MDKQTALKIILAVSIMGVAFSGYLAYSEIFKQTCPIGGCTSTVFAIPSCVYGFFMYTLVLIVSAIGLKAKN